MQFQRPCCSALCHLLRAMLCRVRTLRLLVGGYSTKRQGPGQSAVVRDSGSGVPLNELYDLVFALPNKPVNGSSEGIENTRILVFYVYSKRS